ncbi:type II toxin-antitoxin system death-on-curing family toxin [Companilactobacillus baiquanensis]|uniref:Type II toxin-antitoxin system death-on-curing family toxin n=1 Tax=Companilactobacillus baiquanensis TaxID=2486005 RepID=A0ABW1USA4_9LACO|nr:type II toxin-antitoxin system death-on-curing family toxin [Companilactobacillus baiquanensis]
MKYLTKQELIAMNKLILSRIGSHYVGVQYTQGLDLVIEQPKQVVFGKELYPNIWLKAAFIIQKITKKHIFNDGNKRTALVAGSVFLELNGYELIFTEQEIESLILTITNNEDSETVMISIAEWLKEKSRQK